MIEANLIITYLFFGVFGGVLATAAFSGLLFFFDRVGVTKGSMIIALGSLLTHSRDRAAHVGLLVHLGSGVFFGLLYTWGLMAIGVSNFGGILLLGMLFGLLHGVIVAVGLVASVSDFHPLPEYRSATWTVGLTHALAHVAYGAVMGLVVGLSGLVRAG